MTAGAELADPPAPTDHLVPRPRTATTGDGAWEPGAGVVKIAAPVSAADDRVVATAISRVREAFAQLGVETMDQPDGGGDVRGDVRLRLRSEGEGGAESYRLSIGPDGIDLEAADAAGLLHGSATLAQWLAITAAQGRGNPLTVPALEVDDAPDFRHRGVLLDISRDKVPRMATLRALVRWLSGLKVNQLQLYMEHTFAYIGHEEVWRGASPLTPEDVRELDALCRDHAIELVPTQNSFGHFHRWLTHPDYRPLAECPDGVAHPWAHPDTGGPAGDGEPFSLCATDPGSLDLLADLYAQLLPCFTSRQLNAGLDEAFDLGRCRSREACEERGRHRVYLDFLGEVARLARSHGRSLQFWGDILLEEPGLAAPGLTDLFPDDAVALIWGHEPGHPFAEDGAKLAAAGVEFHVCPGTSAWTSLGGRLDVALANTAEAAAQGHAAGATGYLLTDWGDFGHLQPLPISLPGLLAGCAAAWNAGRPVKRGEVAGLVALHAFGTANGRSSGDGASDLARALIGLGTAHRLAGGPNVNGTALFYLLLKPARDLDDVKLAGLTRESLEAARVHLAECRALLERAERFETRDEAGDEANKKLADKTGHGPTEDLWNPARAKRELAWVAAMLDLACRVGLARFAAGEGGAAADLAAVPGGVRRELAADLDRLLARRRSLWLARNRPGGLEHAFGWLNPLARLLRSTCGDPVGAGPSSGCPTPAPRRR